MAETTMFHYGTAWYPEWEPEGEWRQDLEAMKQAGLNTVRIAEFSWEHIEPREGEFRFELYDQVMARCAELGVWVVLGIDTVRPPVWLFERYPDIHLVDQLGRPAPGSWPMHCFNHPGFKESSGRYIERFVEQYKDSPALIYYQLDNEPAYHMRGSHIARSTSYCYCPHCQRSFRTWLAHRHPKGAPFRVPAPLPEPEVMGELLWLEWRRFHDQTNIRRVDWVAKELKKYDLVHPVTTNIMVGSQFGAGASRIAHNVYGLGRVLDVYGMDIYTDVRQDYRPNDAMIYSISDRLGSGEGYHCLETQPTTCAVTQGGWGGQQKGFRKYGDDRRLIPWGWRPLAFGARSLLYWVWRLQWPNVWSIARPDGTLTDFAEQTRRLSAEFEKAWPSIQGSQLKPSEVAVIHNRDTIHLAARQDLAEVPGESIVGAFTACWERRILADVLDEELALTGALGGYKVVLAPYLSVSTARLSEALRQFVARGGTLIWDARSGSYGEDDGGFKELSGAGGWSLNYCRAPSNGMGEVMGYRSLMVYGAEKPEFMLEAPLGDLPAGASFAGLNWWDEWEPEPSAQVLARFANGKPALVTNVYGEGRTYACAVDLFRAFGKGQAGNGALIAAILQQAGVRPWAEVSGLTPEVGRQLEVVLRSKGDRTYLFALNSNPVEAAPRITLQGHYAEARDIIAGAPVRLDQGSTLLLELEPYQVGVVELFT